MKARYPQTGVFATNESARQANQADTHLGLERLMNSAARNPSTVLLCFRLMLGSTFRLARLSDAEAIALMSRELIEAGLSGWSWDPQRVAHAIRARDTVVLVAAVQNPLVGFAIMNFGDTSAHLSLLAVKPTHQRCGIGGRMMAWLEESALVAGIATINLELRTNNSAARDFYRALGFTETAYVPGYYQGVETALRMSRDIRRQTSDHIGWLAASLRVSELRSRRR